MFLTLVGLVDQKMEITFNEDVCEGNEESVSILNRSLTVLGVFTIGVFQKTMIYDAVITVS